MAKQEGIQLLEGEIIEKDNVKGDYWSGGIGPFMQTQTNGVYIFTNNRILFKPTGLFSGKEMLFTLAYSEIASIKTCQVGLFIPTGIFVTMKDGKKYKLSFLKRKTWVDFIQAHMA